MGADGGKTRVVVTGLGAVTPLGNSVPEYWRALCEGRSGVGAHRYFALVYGLRSRPLSFVPAR